MLNGQNHRGLDHAAADVLADDVLIGRCRRGDMAAFGPLIERYQDRLFNTLFRMVGNEDDGIRLEDSKEVSIRSNTVERNGDDGIAVEEHSRRNEIAENRIRSNEEDGIDLDESDRNQIVGNRILENGRDPRRDNGIELRDSDRNWIDANEIRDNADGLTDEIRCQHGSRRNAGSNVPAECR